jgi:NADH-quinone oxidoreductase subunit L
MNPSTLALLLIVVPVGSAALTASFLRQKHALATVLSVLVATFYLGGALHLALSGVRFEQSFEWLKLAHLSINLGFKFDDLAALMLSIVGIVGFCVHIFSLGYMKEDPAKARYFAGLSIFMASMTGIVFADNLFMMFIFWELVGFSSYVLINHWHEKNGPMNASKKAFIANRVGDFGFLIGIIMCYWLRGTVNLSELAAQTSAGSAAISTAIPLLLFCGAVGKSAQLPLQVWLPDAMEGPTPVSALIHAATMVAAGIYMLCRIEVLMVPDALLVISWVGALTAIYAACCAIIQRDIKKVLAYSTLSQLGYMVTAFGLGSLTVRAENGAEFLIKAGVGAAMFHLTTHAFFKALLFLGSGSVIHGCHHEQDIFKMGGLRSHMKVTFITFTLGVAAISGFPLLAGFFSKDAILYLAYSNNKAIFALLALTAALTAFYMIRMWIIVFFGKARSDEAAHAHEGGFVLQAPLVLLALLAVFGGYRGLYPHGFEGILSLVAEAEGPAKLGMLGVSLIVLSLGAGGAFALYRSVATLTDRDPLEAQFPKFFVLVVTLKESFDSFYLYYVEKVQQRFAMLLNFFDLLGLAGLIRVGAGAVSILGLGVRALHVGKLNVYLYWFFLGVVLLWLYAAGIF